LRRARHGAGELALIEAGAGTGKSRLLAIAARTAEDEGLRVLSATGRELEQAFPFGVAVQLFEPSWLATGPDGVADLFRGPAAPARSLTRDIAVPPSDWFPVIHGLFSLARHLAAPVDGIPDGGLALLVDDVDRADAPSLRLLAYLAARIAGLPIAVVLAARSGRPSVDDGALGALRRVAACILRPADLTPDAVAALVRERLPGAEPGVAAECARLTGGNPFLVAELLGTLTGAAVPPDDLVPAAVTHMLTAELALVPSAALALASAVATLGDGQPLARAAAVAGLDMELAARSADALAGAGLMAPGSPLSFRHPLIGRAVRRRVPELQVAARHHRTAAPPTGTAPPATDDPVDPAARVLSGSLRGEPRQQVRALADRAWGDGTVLAVADPSVAARLAGALVHVDELERSLEILDDARHQAMEREDPTIHGVAGYARAAARYHQGAVAAAAAAARSALGAHTPPGQARPDRINALVAACLVHLGQLDRADALLATLVTANEVADDDLPVLLDVRAQLRLAQRRPGEALVDALEAGRRAARLSPQPHPGLVAWRSTGALARVALEEPVGARELAEEELELARQIDLPRVTLRALRALGLAATGRRRIDLFAEAVAVGDQHPPRLEYIEALIALGAATRRANRRTAARGPLSTALALSRQLGATVLGQRAEEELAAGEGHRQRRLDAGVTGLTASERRVAALAAEGRTTRQMAGELFVTTKTIEFHLRHVYRKLGIPSTRAELTRALRTEDVTGSGATPFGHAGE
jgi:DNA-binding CsgD family transcriptional regulator